MPIPTQAPIYRDLSEWVVLQVLDAIRTGAIAPGERLVEREVAARFGVSRAPVRDALHKLERLEVVERVRPRGVVVRDWGPEDAAEVYLLMDALILLSVRLATPRLTAADLGSLGALVAQVDDGARSGTMTAADVVPIDLRFHELIAAATGRRRLVAMMESLVLPVTLYAAEPSGHLQPELWLRLHAELLEHLRRRDVDGAVACVMRNADESELIFMQRLESSGTWHDPLLEHDRGALGRLAIIAVGQDIRGSSGRTARADDEMRASHHHRIENGGT